MGGIGQHRTFLALDLDEAARRRLEELFASVESALQPRGFAAESRAFSPHVTVARVLASRDGEALHTSCQALDREDFGTISAQAVTVYTSQLRRAGPIYTPVK